MKEADINKLCERYEEMVRSGCKYYFEPDELDVIADYYEENMAFEKALSAISYGMSLYPGFEPFKIHKARCLLATGNIIESFEILQSIIDHNLEYYFILAEVELLQDNISSALEAFKHIVNDVECTLEDCIDVIDICAEVNQTQLLQDFTQFVKKRFDDVTPYLRELALLYEETEDNELAISIYNEILDINPFSADDWFSLAKVYARMQDYNKAIEACDFALAINDSDDNILAFRGYCLYDSGQYAEAVEQFIIFLEKTNDKLFAYELIAEVYERMELHEDAINYLHKAIELNDSNHDLYYKLAVSHYYMGDNEQAILHLYKAVACDNNDIEAHSFLGELLLENEDFEEAYKHLSLIDYRPVTDTVPASALADVCIHLQKYDESLDILLQLIEKDPYDPHYIFDIILCYMQLGDYDKALQWVAQSEEISNDDKIIEQLPVEIQKSWLSIRERIEQLRNILSVYIDEK